MATRATHHTPGPWKVIKPGHGHPTEYLCVQLGDDERYTTLEMQPADARLTAAAPDLLAAAKRALSVFKAQGEAVLPGNVLGALDKAIAKATNAEATR